MNNIIKNYPEVLPHICLPVETSKHISHTQLLAGLRNTLAMASASKTCYTLMRSPSFVSLWISTLCKKAPFLDFLHAPTQLAPQESILARQYRLLNRWVANQPVEIESSNVDVPLFFPIGSSKGLSVCAVNEDALLHFNFNESWKQATEIAFPNFFSYTSAYKNITNIVHAKDYVAFELRALKSVYVFSAVDFKLAHAITIQGKLIDTQLIDHHLLIWEKADEDHDVLHVYDIEQPTASAKIVPMPIGGHADKQSLCIGRHYAVFTRRLPDDQYAAIGLSLKALLDGSCSAPEQIISKAFVSPPYIFAEGDHFMAIEDLKGTIACYQLIASGGRFENKLIADSITLFPPWRKKLHTVFYLNQRIYACLQKQIQYQVHTSAWSYCLASYDLESQKIVYHRALDGKEAVESHKKVSFKAQFLRSTPLKVHFFAVSMGAESKISTLEY